MLQWHHYPDQIAPTNTIAAPKGNDGPQDVAAANNVLPFLMLMMDKTLLSISQNANDIDEIAETVSEERQVLTVAQGAGDKHNIQ